MSDELVTIEFIPAKMELDDFLPKYEYILKGKEVSDDSKYMKESLVGFLALNQELIIHPQGDTDEYIRGFKQAIAITKLWLDSIYVRKPSDVNPPETTNK